MKLMVQLAFQLTFTAVVFLTNVMLLVACSSNPNKAEKVETQMESKGNVKGENVGIKDGNMVVQKKTLMSEELRRLQYEVYELEDKVYGNRKFGSDGLYGVLKKCRLELSDKDNGGDGKLKWLEPMERITDKEDEYKIGIDEENNLVAVSEEYIKDRIVRFRGYKQTLMKREDEYQEKVDICKSDLKARKQVKKEIEPSADEGM